MSYVLGLAEKDTYCTYQSNGGLSSYQTIEHLSITILLTEIGNLNHHNEMTSSTDKPVDIEHFVMIIGTFRGQHMKN